MLFSNFTEKARIAISEAHDAAAEMGHNYIGSEHLLMGLIREGSGVAAKVLEKNGVTVTVKENRTTPELASALDQGHPVLLCIQAWAAAEDGYNTQNSDDADTYLGEGHWVICVGYQKQEPGYVFYFNDPACVGYCMMSEQDLNNRWIDMDTEGNVYDHYGIEITADGTSYNPDGVFYLE